VSRSETDPIELLLDDGGRVIVDFATESAVIGYGDAIVETMLETNGNETDVERAIRSQAADLGVAVAVSAGHHPTVLVIGDADAPGSERLPRATGR
jgi:hypothetical protein